MRVNSAATVLLDLQKLHPLLVVHTALIFVTQNYETEVRRKYEKNYESLFKTIFHVKCNATIRV